MMKLVSIFSFILLFFNARAQLLKPATFKATASASEVKVGETVDIYFDAAIDKNWYMYSNDFDPDL